MGHQTPQNPASRRHHVPEGEVRAAKRAKTMRMIGAATFVAGLAVGALALAYLETPLRMIALIAAGSMLTIGPVLIATNKRK